MSDRPPDERTLEILTQGDLELRGLVPWSSNYTFIVSARLDDEEIPAVYKPQGGERPLWDFDSGTLYLREVAAYRVSACLGWPNIPPVVRREGPHGWGSCSFSWSTISAHYFSCASKRPTSRPCGMKYSTGSQQCRSQGGPRAAGPRRHHLGHRSRADVPLQYKLRTVIWD